MFILYDIQKSIGTIVCNFVPHANESKLKSDCSKSTTV